MTPLCLYWFRNKIASSRHMNRHLEKISLWAWQWKIHFIVDKTEEILFSARRLPPVHRPLKVGNDEMKIQPEYKHLGMILN